MTTAIAREDQWIPPGCTRGHRLPRFFRDYLNRVFPDDGWLDPSELLNFTP